MKTISDITTEITNDPIYSSFIKYLGEEQLGKNDYQVGCIQAVNALMPAITKLIVHSVNLEYELNKLK